MFQYESMVKEGLYRHYKGGLYWVIGTAITSTNGQEGQIVVVYRSSQTSKLYTRHLAEFLYQDDGVNSRFVPENV